MEEPGSEGLRIVIDSDHGNYRRLPALFAECFAIIITFGNGERPSVLIGQHLRLFLVSDDRHDASVCRNTSIGALSAWSTTGSYCRWVCAESFQRLLYF